MKIGRPRLEDGEIRVPVKVSCSASTHRNARAAGLNLSSLFESALQRKLEGQLFLPEIQDKLIKAIHGMEQEFDKHGVLSPDDRLKFAKIRRTIRAIKGDAYIDKAALEDIVGMVASPPPNNGDAAKIEIKKEAST